MPVLAETEADYKAEIKAVDDQIQQLANEVDAIRNDRLALLEKISSTTARIEDRASRIRSLQNDIDTYQKQLDRLETQVHVVEESILTNRQQLGSMIRTSMLAGANNGLQVMLQHTDPALASRLGVYYDYYFRASSRLIRSATGQLTTLRAARLEAQKSRNWLQHLQKKATGQKQSYAGAQEATARSISEVDATITTIQRSVENLRLDQKRLGKLLKELKENSLGESGFFAASKGKYPWPVKGQLAASFGDVKSVGKLKWTGMYIEADEGQRVRSVAAGEVVYADWLQGFGKLVIVDHGDGYMTLYGGNRELRVRRDDWVETGAYIATVGDSRGHKKPGVYFEIRHNAKPINPEIWVSAKNHFKTADK